MLFITSTWKEKLVPQIVAGIPLLLSLTGTVGESRVARPSSAQSIIACNINPHETMHVHSLSKKQFLETNRGPVTKRN